MSSAEAKSMAATTDDAPSGAYVSLRGLHKRYSKDSSAPLVLNDVSLEVAEGELLSLLGPSGCGKTTTLRCLAGLERPDQGSIWVRGVPMVDTATKRFVPPERRKIGMAFQSYALWPHMKVINNVAYPLRVAKAPDALKRAGEALERVGLSGKGDRYPRQLSGGEQQRVALARAIVAGPDVLLLDEPLSNLDAKLRQETLVWLVGLLRELNITTVYVTHDQSEALAISDRIAVMRSGVVVQQGTPNDIYQRPESHFVARFVGSANLMTGSVISRNGADVTVHLTAGGRVFPAKLAAYNEASVGDTVRLVVRPESMFLHPAEPTGSSLRAKVALRVYFGNGWEYLVDVDGHQIRVVTPPTVALDPGSDVWLTLDGTGITALADDSTDGE
jgi:iron(III) transport system ATP-binding protein